MSDTLVTIDCTDGVADVRFNRADRHNSLTLEMFAAISDAIDAVNADRAVRVVVLSGEGPSFCAGLDLSLLKAMLAGGEAAATTLASLMRRDDGPDNLAQRVAYGWKAARVPVIGALHGVAYGGGFQIALGCDIRIAHPATRFSIMEARYGLVPDMSITQTLPELLPRDVALELTLTARVFDAAEAASLGLVTRLAEDPRAAALELARTVANQSPDAVQAVKRLYNASWRADAAAGLRLEEALQIPLIGSPNQIEAVRASMEKRAPRFDDAAGA
ncbi:MAG: crotonase/enoyl-CoA hydratase family protein [Gammaproteobacteria bacterium]